MNRFIVCICLYGLLFLGGAIASPLYTSSVIVINEQGATAQDAKNKGFQKAKNTFWHKVIQRILLDPDEARKVSQTERESFIKKIDVLSEKTHSNRYRAEIIIYLDPLRIQQSLRKKSIAFVEDKGFPALIVPVFTYKGIMQIYEYTNMWQTALQNIDSSGGLLPLYVSDRGMQDSLKVDRHVLANRDKMLRFGLSYGADTVLIASVHVESTGIVLKYKAIGGILDGTQYTLIEKFPTPIRMGQPNTDTIVLNTLGDLAVRFFQDAELQWKKQHALAEKQGNKIIQITFSINTLDDWQALKTRLQTYPMVQAVELYSVQGNIVTASVQYTGVLKNFYLFLQQKKYDINTQDTVWIVDHTQATS